MNYLTLEDLVFLAQDLGVPMIRDMGLLDSAAHRPSSSLFGREAYLTIHEKAAALLESLVRNHPLVDGNKRLGWLSIVVFYGVNGWDLDAPDDEAYDLVIAVATGRSDIASGASRLETWATRS